MNKQHQIGREILQITYRCKRLVFAKQMAAGVDKEIIMNGRILGFLSSNEGRDIFQKDIEQETSLTKSSVSNLLTKMEQKGLIKRQSIAGDARLKKIVLTELGSQINEKNRKAIDAVDMNFVRGLTVEEQDQLLRILKKINCNMKGMEEESRHDCRKDIYDA